MAAEGEEGDEEGEAQGPTLRVLNFNAQEYKHDWRARFAAFAALVKQTQPHLIAVQVSVEIRTRTS